MTDRITAGQWHVPVVPQSQSVRKQTAVQPPSSALGAKTFQSVLQDQMVRFSNHAEVRLQQRGIKLDSKQLAQLDAAVRKAEDKGAKESLILFKDVALIVNVKNRTVVTAMDSNQMKDNVFTQIDSAVILS